MYAIRSYYETLVMVTHDQHIAEYGDKIIHLLDGRITDVVINETKITKQNEPMSSGN